MNQNEKRMNGQRNHYLDQPLLSSRFKVQKRRGIKLMSAENESFQRKSKIITFWFED